MPLNIKPYVDPATTALLVSECQQAILGDQSPLEGLVAATVAGNTVANIAALLNTARQHRVKIYHCLVERPADGFGEPLNTPLTSMMARTAGPGSGMAPNSAGAQPVAALTPAEEDIVVRRRHGITAFHETGLDHLLRNTQVETVIFTGVSLNLAIFGGTIEAVNRGYRVVIPTDCVAADPPEYGDALLNYSLRNMAYLTDSQRIVSAWQP